MASPSRLMFLAMAFAIATVVVESLPRKIVMRQSPIDNSNIDNVALLKCFANITEGKGCPGLLLPTVSSTKKLEPEPPTPGCRCAPRWQCLDGNEGPTAAIVQEKWKVIRSCYIRELLRKKNEKSGSGASVRKQYSYFETVRFLETVSKQTASSINETTSLDNENGNIKEISLEIQKETRETEKRRHNQSRKRKNKEDDELIALLQNKILHESQETSGENYKDRLFLLSLVSKLHKVPADRKLKLKSDIIATIVQAQQGYQQWPQHLQYQTPHTYHPSNTSLVSHYAQQPTFHGGHHHSLNITPQSRYATVESTTTTPAPSPALSDDNQAQFGQFPWMAAVMTTSVAGNDSINVYVSGGSLIHPRVVMTAAHYMHDKTAQGLAVRLGEWDFELSTEPIPHQDIRVSRIAIHPQFVANDLTYDIALLFLEKDAELGPTVGTVCLPEPLETFDGATCYVSGWGKDAFGQQGKYQQILKSLKLPVVSHADCQRTYRGTRLGSTFNLHKSFMCAGGERDVDTCTGDGGSPLVCPKVVNGADSYVQTGIVAWGLGCGEEGIPGVYASISDAVPWIGQELPAATFDIR